MSLLLTNAGETEMLQKFLSANRRLKLYTNNKTPAEGDLLADYTEAVGNGYSDKQLLIANWIYDLDENDARASYPEQEFIFTGAVSIYGYYITDDPATKVLWAERFSDAPWVFPSGGGTGKITARIKQS